MTRTRQGRLLLGAVSFAMVSLLFSATSSAEVVRTGYTTIVAGNSGKCMDIAGASATPGAAANQWHCNFNPNEQWNVQPFNGAFRLIERQTGQCLAVAGGSTFSGTQLVQNTCTGVASELWTFAAVGGGFQIISQSGSHFCASVSNASVADSASIVQAPCSTAANFIWTFSSGLVGPTTLVDLLADHSGQCLNVNGASKGAGANVVQWPCSGTANEQWSLVPSGSNYRVVSKNSNLCLAVRNASTSSGASIEQAACGNAASQLWTLKPVGRAYQLIARNSGLCLTVGGASQTPAAQVTQSTCSTNLSQLWSVSPAVISSNWSNVVPLAVNPIAIANLPNGKVLAWSAYDPFTFQGDIGDAAGRTYTSVFDPNSGSSSSILVTNTGDDMFCPGTANLPDGRVLVNGGSSSAKTSLYDPSTALWASSGQMNLPRGYQGDTLLSTGAVFTLGGSWSGGQGGKDGELWTNGSWRRLTGVTAAPITGPDPQGVYRGDNHLWLFAAANGRVFHAGPSAQMHWITTTGNGSITSAGNRADDPYAINGNAVLYDVGTILKAGGAPAYQNTNATTSAYTIKFAASVAVTKIAPMAYPRAFSNGVVLPDGEVVIIGGQTVPVPFSDDTTILISEIWDPDTQVFRQLKPMQTPRNYHSTALLLADGRVFSGGGGQCGQGCASNHFNTEILTPPYLLNADGSAATRPSITAAPTTASLGGTLAVTTNTPVMQFVLMRLSSTTHTVNNDQRRIPLQIQATNGATSYTLAIPADPGTVLPGYYFLFAMNAKNVPSVAATVRIN